ncbi:MAG: two component transcriptional regulator, LuxR family [Acidobacteriales bacterium]|nr:two component transcriptional regulator, LuxR family [Terriglobales bacterium]
MPKSLTAVIADDHVIFRDGLRRLLEMDRRIRVIAEAGDGEEAVAQSLRHKPDVLLLDMAMPRMSGLEALKKLSGANYEKSILVLTAEIEPSQLTAALKAGAKGIVRKESATQVLLEAVRAVVDGFYWIGTEPLKSLDSYFETMDAVTLSSKQKKFSLTPRELEIVKAIADGCTNRDIAAKFSITSDTVKHHLSNIFDKVGTSSRLELALFAVHHELHK